MTRLKRLLASFMLTFSFAVPALVPAVAAAQGTNNTDQLCAGADLQFTLDPADDVCEGDGEGDAGDTLTGIVTTIINILSVVVGIVAVIMIIVGGFQYLTSQGDSGKVTNAKNTILYAIVGLVIVALAQIIVQFVTGRLGNAPASDG